MAVGSGVLYALVICCLRYLRGQSSIWLTLLNQLGSGICLGLGVIIFSGVDEFLAWFTGPTLNQFVFLACFGAVQMGFSYYFFARGLKKLSPQEAGFITLLEPILNPLWVWLAFGETNPISIWIGGAFILFALGWRYSSKT
jgi:drug/metabolite transporter (DMT)-like permease